MPDEGPWFFVVVLDEAADGVFQLAGGAMDSATELLFGEQSEPAFDQVEPTGRGGREVQMEARPLHQPVTNQLRLVCSVVIQDERNVQLGRYIFLDRIEKNAKLDGAVAALSLADQLAGPGV